MLLKGVQQKCDINIPQLLKSLEGQIPFLNIKQHTVNKKHASFLQCPFNKSFNNKKDYKSQLRSPCVLNSLRAFQTCASVHFIEGVCLVQV